MSAGLSFRIADDAMARVRPRYSTRPRDERAVRRAAGGAVPRPPP
ncbi:hypothetical protein [Streptomyces sp. PTD5-9]